MPRRGWSATCGRSRSFGSTPRRIILDNLKSGVLHPDLYDPLLNRGYAELAHHFGCLIDPARSAKPKDKPRVERQVPFVRESFWTGRSFSSLEEINAAAERWCLRVAGPRNHGTTHIPPLLLFQTIEQPAMLPLPATPFEIVTWARAKVAHDCHVQVQGSLYSIPWRYVGQTLDVRVAAVIVRFYAGAELATTHLRGKPGQRRSIPAWPGSFVHSQQQRRGGLGVNASIAKASPASIPPQLVAAVKTLKLGGMQESLPIRLDQAQQQRLGYSEWRQL